MWGVTYCFPVTRAVSKKWPHSWTNRILSPPTANTPFTPENYWESWCPSYPPAWVAPRLQSRSKNLLKVGADTFIRVGTAGAMQPGMSLGDVAIVTGAIRDEGTTRQYLPLDYPAVADLTVVNALVAAAKTLGIGAQLGVSHTKDNFYGEIEMDRMPIADEIKMRWKAWVAGGAICSEMEASAIFILSSIYRKRAGAVLTVVGSDTETLKAKKASPDAMILVAVEAIRGLIRQDRGG